MFFRNSARSFPHDIIEAARIDGLNEVQIFARMFVPVMRPTYAAAATITFMNAWNSYLWPKVIMQTNESTTMPMLVSNLMAGYVIDYGVVMMGHYHLLPPPKELYRIHRRLSKIKPTNSKVRMLE